MPTKPEDVLSMLVAFFQSNLQLSTTVGELQKVIAAKDAEIEALIKARSPELPLPKSNGNGAHVS